MLEQPKSSRDEVAAYREGQRQGLAIAALAAALIAFIQLLGVEKMLLAIVLAALAMRGAATHETAYKWARTAIVVAGLELLILVVTIVLFHGAFIELLHLVQKLS